MGTGYVCGLCFNCIMDFLSCILVYVCISFSVELEESALGDGLPVTGLEKRLVQMLPRSGVNEQLVSSSTSTSGI